MMTRVPVNVSCASLVDKFEVPRSAGMLSGSDIFHRFFWFQELIMHATPNQRHYMNTWLIKKPASALTPFTQISK